MGRPSDQKRSARRLGKSQRERVKNRYRSRGVMATVPGAGTVEIKAGRKKFSRIWSFWIRYREAHLAGEPVILNPCHCIKRPGYKMWWSDAKITAETRNHNH